MLARMGEVRELLEACRKNVHLCSPQSMLAVTSSLPNKYNHSRRSTPRLLNFERPCGEIRSTGQLLGHTSASWSPVGGFGQNLVDICPLRFLHLILEVLDLSLAKICLIIGVRRFGTFYTCFDCVYNMCCLYMFVFVYKSVYMLYTKYVILCNMCKKYRNV